MERRPLRFEHLDEALAEIRKLAGIGYDRAGNWSLEQNVDHLNKTMRMAIEGTSFKFPALIRPILKWLFYGKMKRGERIKTRATAPAPLQPDDDLRLESLIDEFEKLAAQIESPDTELVDLHPVFGKFSREEWQIMQRWHAAHHLSFLIPKEGQPLEESESAGGSGS